MPTRRIEIVGGGPGGLYAARLLKLARPRWQITVREQMAGSRDTFGFGVSLTASTMANLEEADTVSAADIRDVSHYGHGLRLLGDGETAELHDARNLAIGRSRLLEILARRATEAGVLLRAGGRTEAAVLDADVIVAADGVRSATREKLADEFGATVSIGRGMYMWCGSAAPLDNAIFAPTRTSKGLFVAHAYPHAADRSTFLIEADEASWRSSGLDRGDAATPDDQSDGQSLRYLEAAFAAQLRGHPLLGNRSRWLRFHTVSTERWSHGNLVLIGDAAHTAHYTLGSGTKLALEDAIALSRSLLAEDDPADAFAAYEQSRRPAVTRFQQLAARSQRWWESYHLRARQPVDTIAAGFMTRAGNITLEQVAATNWILVRRAAARYSPGAPLPAGPGELLGWVLAQPYRGRPGRESRLVIGSSATDEVVHLDPRCSDPWAAEVAPLVDRARSAADRGRVVWLAGPADVPGAEARLDVAERIKLETSATVGVDLPWSARADAIAGLVAGRCDLIRFNEGLT